MPQNERLQFAKISNELVQLTETILKEEYGLQIQTESDTKKESFNLYDPSEPFNRRLVELSLKIKEMGKAWDQIPDEIKREIVKKFVLFDFQKNLLGLTNNKKEADHIPNGNEGKKEFVNLISQSSVNKQTDLNNLEHDFDTKEVGEQREMSNNRLKMNDQIDYSRLKEDNLNIDKKDVVIINFFDKDGDSINRKDIKSEFTKQNLGRNMLERTGMGELSSAKHRFNQNTKMIASESSVTDGAYSTQRKPMNEPEDSTKTDKNIQDWLQHNNQTQRLDNASAESFKDIDIKNTVNDKGIGFSQKQIFNFSAEDMRKVIDILQNTLSKPLAMETNLEHLEKLSKITISETEKTGQPLSHNLLGKSTTEHYSQNIMRILEKIIPSDKMVKEAFHSFLSFSNHNFPDLSSVESFEKMIKTTLMNMEIKDMISSLKSYGVPTQEAYHTTLDIVNIAARSIQEDTVAQQIYSTALKKYLKMSLPQLIINHQIDQRDEDRLINKVESFSKKVFLIIKAYAEKLITNKEQEIHTTNVKIVEKEENNIQNNRLKTTNDAQNQIEPKGQFTKNEASMNSAIESHLRHQQEKSGTTTQQTDQMLKMTSEIRVKEGSIENNNQKEPGSNSLSNQKNQQNQNFQSEKGNPVDSKLNESTYRTEIGSERILKFLNVSTEKSDFSTAYSSLMFVNSQPFVIDLQHQMMNKAGYEKSEMYRVFIETNTQLFGSVFVDTVVTNNNIDIYIYAEQQYTKTFTNHSATLIKRIKETDYQLRGIFIREKLDQNGILKYKMKRFSNFNKEGGFYQFA